ncbi:bifunctional helix-turn-helix transcriptional regulator/GNAT family N-acetyltransferase [Allonocardiopsis opalescens]|uniref:MarR family transcriptional regulator with acetyltransferase activity n=1 Tax=Allonocardiopsis opalescens TaxID=1144618 RepID=A0A2T0PWZ1_9ACTN|nr:bifunctional helix-turn-helix transcriptional regulator/GNAT family N-acetyltransferase [Allonocardiopsis opalescens]PRX96054.1 MarR family transcriptional regulator with acetyltransferase activity [Allonocardiopsis opalescens]
MSDESVAEVRAFNRFYTRVIGLLDQGLLGSPYSLTESRVLWELANPADGSPVEVGGLRAALGLDAGYLSRILVRLSSAGLIVRERSDGDGRRRTVQLTQKGRAVQKELDDRSSADVLGLLSALSDDERDRLLDAMSTVRRLLGDRRSAPVVVLRPPRPGDLGWVVSRNAALYAQEYGWDASYEALVAKIVADYAAGPDPAREAVWIAEVGGARVGCVFCVRDDDETARLRLLLVEPAARGLGIGGRLVDECIAFARAAGYRRMTLWTNDVLAAARRIYQRAGFTLTDQAPHRSFGHDLTGQNWSREL